MKLHSEKEFRDAITATAQYLALNEVLIEKDYWVTKTLKNLSNSEYRDKVVFKGGTSLSKAHKIIHRFSEDVDLALITTDQSGSQIKTLIRKVEKAAIQDLKEIEIDGITSKGSKYRKTVYEYPKKATSLDYGQASDKLIIEINSFTQPHPHTTMQIQSYITEFLHSISQYNLVDQYNLEPFELKTLSLDRTFFEKLLGIVRVSYDEQNIDKLKKRVRHIYDLHQLLKDESIRELLSDQQKLKEMIELVKEDDRSNYQFAGPWIDNPILLSPFFKQNLITELATTYNGQFRTLVFGELPSFNDVKSSIDYIAGHISGL